MTNAVAISGLGSIKAGLPAVAMIMEVTSEDVILRRAVDGTTPRNSTSVNKSAWHK